MRLIAGRDVPYSLGCDGIPILACPSDVRSFVPRADGLVGVLAGTRPGARLSVRLVGVYSISCP